MHNIFVVKIFLQRYLVLCIKKHFFSHGIQEFFRLNGQKSLLTRAYTCDKILLQKYLYFFSKVYKNQSFYTEIMQNYAKISGFCRSLRKRRACGKLFLSNFLPFATAGAYVHIIYKGKSGLRPILYSTALCRDYLKGEKL